MEDINSLTTQGEGTSLGSKSWVAYVRVVVLALLLLLVATAAWTVSPALGGSMLAISAVVIIYQILVIKSFHLYFDDVGVWVFSGVLPWNKGLSGVKWRDLDEAVFFRSMWSWLFKSYSIRIGHRFTKTSEIVLTHWARGDEVVSRINAAHEELVRADALR